MIALKIITVVVGIIFLIGWIIMVKVADERCGKSESHHNDAP